MPARTEVLGDGTICREKPLGGPRGLEALQPPFPLARGWMRVLGPGVQRAVLAVYYPWQQLLLRRTVAVELIGHADVRHVPQAFEPLAEELLGGLRVPSALHQEIENMALVIDGTPQIGVLGGKVR